MGMNLHEFAGHIFKELLHIVGGFGADPNNFDPIRVAPVLLFLLDVLFEPVIALIGQDEDLFGITLHEGVLDPFGLDIIKGPLIVDIIDDDDGMRPVVIGLGDVLEPLLPGGVPDL